MRFPDKSPLINSCLLSDPRIWKTLLFALFQLILSKWNCGMVFVYATVGGGAHRDKPHTFRIVFIFICGVWCVRARMWNRRTFKCVCVCVWVMIIQSPPQNRISIYGGRETLSLSLSGKCEIWDLYTHRMRKWWKYIHIWMYLKGCGKTLAILYAYTYDAEKETGSTFGKFKHVCAVHVHHTPHLKCALRIHTPKKKRLFIMFANVNCRQLYRPNMIWILNNF